MKNIILSILCSISMLSLSLEAIAKKIDFDKKKLAVIFDDNSEMKYESLVATSLSPLAAAISKSRDKNTTFDEVVREIYKEKGYSLHKVFIKTLKENLIKNYNIELYDNSLLKDITNSKKRIDTSSIKDKVDFVLLIKVKEFKLSWAMRDKIYAHLWISPKLYNTATNKVIKKKGYKLFYYAPKPYIDEQARFIENDGNLLFEYFDEVIKLSINYIYEKIFKTISK